MMKRISSIAGVVAVMLLTVGRVGRGQEPATTPVRQTATGDQVAAVRAAVLGRKIALRLEGATLKQALDAIVAAGNVRLAYSQSDVPVEKRITLVVDTITVGDALVLLLRDTGIEITVSPSGQVVLRPATRHESNGSIVGSITDSITGSTIPLVIVRVEETGQTATSSAQGQYTIADVAPGEYRVTAKRVGFIPRTRPVIVEDGKVATLDFKLGRPPTKLDEVVTTAAGDQRRYQVGNDIATINVDSVAPTAPVTSVTDVLTSRVPGLDVVETGGLTGSGEAIRIRGTSSMALQSDPILIVDGIRQDNSPGGTYNYFLNTVTASPSRLNDIDFSQIETIDVLKGPAASTEYGTDAANGVIVITTKRGTSGKPQWHGSAEEGYNDIPTGFPDYYYSWGHTTDGTHTPVMCPLISLFGAPAVSTKTCAVDSVTRYNALNDPATSIYGTGSRAKYTLDVGGGTDAIRYYAAGGLTNEIGALRLPPPFVPEAQALGFPAAVYNPNSLQQRSGRANTFFRLGSTADVSVSAAYLSTTQTVPSLADGLFNGAAYGGGAPPDSANNYGYGPGRYSSPLARLGLLESQQTKRFTGGLTMNWRPAAWFVANGTAGVDHGSQQSEATLYPQLGAYQGSGPNTGTYSLTQASTDIYSADVRASATAALTRAVRAVTTFGLNLRDTRANALGSQAQNLSAGNLTLVGAASVSTTQSGSRSATLGGYGEEQLQVADRLFLIGALRVDAASGFGRSYQTATYPKVSVSWLALPQGPTTVRLRGAFGAAGVAPYNGLSLQLYIPVVANGSGGPVNAMQLYQPGNPNLKPEHTAEWEGGFDVGLWGNRVNLTFSGYSKTTNDALYQEQQGWDLGDYQYEINVGEIRNSGVEGEITAIPVQSRAVTWTTTLNASVNHNKLVHLAPGLPPLILGNGVTQRIQPGYPLYGFWGARVHYADANHDGILEPNEVTVDTGASYLGSSLPTQQAAFDTHVTVLHGALSFGGVLTYQGGYKVFNQFAEQEALFGTLAAENVIGSPLWQQARPIATLSFPQHTPSVYFEDGTVLRLQELSVTCALPAQWARAVRVRSVSLTGAVRNVAYWTRYTGGDPGASYANAADLQPSANAFSVNNDIRASGASAVPLARYYQLRLNVGF